MWNKTFTLVNGKKTIICVVLLITTVLIPDSLLDNDVQSKVQAVVEALALLALRHAISKTTEKDG